MLQELVVYRCAVAHYQQLRCRSLVEVPITLLVDNRVEVI